jgi:HSP20 family protein
MDGIKGAAMSEVSVRKVARTTERPVPVFEEAQRMLQKIEQRAFELYVERGSGVGRALDDWLAAERELGWPASEFAEHAHDYTIAVALPGFEPADVGVTATSRELVVHARHRSEQAHSGKQAGAKARGSSFSSADVYRRFELPCEVRLDDVKATLKNGMLSIVAPKAIAAAKPAAVAA